MRPSNTSVTGRSGEASPLEEMRVVVVTDEDEASWLSGTATGLSPSVQGPSPSPYKPSGPASDKENSPMPETRSSMPAMHPSRLSATSLASRSHDRPPLAHKARRTLASVASTPTGARGPNARASAAAAADWVARQTGSDAEGEDDAEKTYPPASRVFGGDGSAGGCSPQSLGAPTPFRGSGAIEVGGSLVDASSTSMEQSSVAEEASLTSMSKGGTTPTPPADSAAEAVRRAREELERERAARVRVEGLFADALRLSEHLLRTSGGAVGEVGTGGSLELPRMTHYSLKSPSPTPADATARGGAPPMNWSGVGGEDDVRASATCMASPVPLTPAAAGSIIDALRRSLSKEREDADGEEEGEEAAGDLVESDADCVSSIASEGGGDGEDDGESVGAAKQRSSDGTGLDTSGSDIWGCPATPLGDKASPPVDEEEHPPVGESGEDASAGPEVQRDVRSPERTAVAPARGAATRTLRVPIARAMFDLAGAVMRAVRALIAGGALGTQWGLLEHAVAMGARRVRSLGATGAGVAAVIGWLAWRMLRARGAAKRALLPM
ncbi:unnamed protein product [Pedinophyceae sp. YPF-701]|nr:unnamed protein product [Pedinophyceae sp. YPF-701]